MNTHVKVIMIIFLLFSQSWQLHSSQKREQVRERTGEKSIIDKMSQSNYKYLRGAQSENCEYIPPVQNQATAADTFYYRFIDSNNPDGPVYDFIDIQNTGQLVATGMDVSSGPIELPFTFQFFGNNFTSLVAAGHGYLSTDPEEKGEDYSNDYPLPAVPSHGGGDRIYVVHEDFTSAVYFQSFTEAPRPHDSGEIMAAVIFQWSAVHSNSTLAPFDFQIIIYENSDMVIQVAAGDPFNGAGSTTGLQDASAAFGFTYAGNKPGYLKHDLAILIVDDKLPEIVSNFTEMDFFIFENEINTETLNITNDGHITMEYIITPVSLDSNLVKDGSFEAGKPNPHWIGKSVNFESPICSQHDCGSGGGTSTPSEGDYWAWFGGGETADEATLTQDVRILMGARSLYFSLQRDLCSGDPNDFLEVLIDGICIFHIDGVYQSYLEFGHHTQIVDITSFADNQMHSLEFYAITTGDSGVTSFAVDEVNIPPGIDWLSVDNTQGEIDAGADQDFQVTINSENMVLGPHRGALVFTINNPVQPEYILPVWVEVAPLFELTVWNYPNPFSTETVIEYKLPKAGLTQIFIFNEIGQKIKTLVDADKNPGCYKIIWDGNDESGHKVSNGIYFYQIRNNGAVKNQKMVLLK